MKKKIAREKTQTKAGRPTKINQEVVRKLETAASLDCTISEMCFYVGISRDTYYRWMKENKELSDRLTTLRSMQILRARQEVVSGIDGNPEFALKYLERKLPDEFGTKKENLQIQQVTTLGNLIGAGDNENNPYLKMSEEELLAEFNRRKKMWLQRDKDKKEAGGDGLGN